VRVFRLPVRAASCNRSKNFLSKSFSFPYWDFSGTLCDELNLGAGNIELSSAEVKVPYGQEVAVSTGLLRDCSNDLL
jgi:hypothetical protein